MMLATETRVRAMPSRPTEVRSRVFDEHRRLRRSLVRLQDLARSVTIDPSLTADLRAALRGLLVEFALHLDSEDEILMPLIETIDAWGPERAGRMREEHRIQRALLQRMFDRAEKRGEPDQLASEVDSLVLRIFRDMHEEEEELLDENLLRDDVVAIDQTCG